MKRIMLSSTFVVACLLGACSNEKDVMCDVIWSAADDTELGRGSIVYEELDDVDAGVENCKADQMDLAERPTDTAKFTCNCST